MTYRIYEGYFGIPVRNLSIGGGSPTTGLAIIASYTQLPTLVLVETNVMSRSLDSILAMQFGDIPAEHIDGSSPREQPFPSFTIG
jgi:hypothetical protein